MGNSHTDLLEHNHTYLHALFPPDTAAVPPEAQGSLAVVPLIADKRYYGEAPEGPARGRGGILAGIAGALRTVICQPHHKGLSVSPWQPGTCGADDAQRLDGAKLLLEVQIRIPRSGSGQSPWGMRILRQD